MSWEEFDTDRFLDEGILDKAGHCLEDAAKQCAAKRLDKPTYMEFINQLQHALLGCAKNDFIMDEGKYFDSVEVGFIDFSKLQSGDYASRSYVFIQDSICKAIAEMKTSYENDFNRKPYLQELMAAFSRVAVGRPEFYFSDGDRMPLLYMKAIQKQA